MRWICNTWVKIFREMYIYRANELVFLFICLTMPVLTFGVVQCTSTPLDSDYDWFWSRFSIKIMVLRIAIIFVLINLLEWLQTLDYVYTVTLR